MKKRKWPFIIGGLFLAVYFGLPLLNRIWFRFACPADFRSAPWAGTWQSESFSLISGRIAAKLPNPIPRDEAFTVEAIVYYDLWCPYRTGSCVPMTLAGYFGSDSSGAGSTGQTPVTVPPRLTLSFKGGSGPSAQTVDYVATSDTQTSVIVGGYRSQGPYDMGRFGLSR